MGSVEFSIAEAEAHIPSLTTLLRQAQRVKARLERYELATVRQRVRTDGTEEDGFGTESLDADFEGMKEQFYNLVERIENRGCIVRNIDTGIIDFYTKFEGREVCFCWKLGDKRIRYWHEHDDCDGNKTRILEIK